MTERLGKYLTCPACGFQIDEHAAIGSHAPRPQPGDAALCLACGQPLLFELDMVGLRFRLPTPLELVAIRQNPLMERALEAWVSAFHRTPAMRTA